jgi:3'-phosphoadenosine 5'-phosphosulfate sulfotransferase (PAPS reductase)/FAD synthetase
MISQAEITAILAKHSRVLVSFSGGKDSLALTHLLEPYKDRFDLVWANTGAMFPHMEEFIRRYGERFKLVELKSNQAERFRIAGLPSDVVPIFNTPLGMQHIKGNRRVVINDWITCCSTLISKPVIDYAKETGATLIIHGQRSSDMGGWSRAGNAEGVELMGLIYDWTTNEVISYIERNGIQLPEQYSHAAKGVDGPLDSLECWNCTAGLTSAKINYMRARYPNLLEQLKPMVRDVYGSILDEIDKNWPGVMNAVDGELSKRL